MCGKTYADSDVTKASIIVGKGRFEVFEILACCGYIQVVSFEFEYSPEKAE